MLGAEASQACMPPTPVPVHTMYFQLSASLFPPTPVSIHTHRLMFIRKPFHGIPKRPQPRMFLIPAITPYRIFVHVYTAGGSGGGGRRRGCSCEASAPSPVKKRMFLIPAITPYRIFVHVYTAGGSGAPNGRVTHWRVCPERCAAVRVRYLLLQQRWWVARPAGVPLPPEMHIFA